MHKLSRADLIEQRIRCDAIGDLAAGEKKSDWAANAIGQSVDFGGATAQASVRSPGFAPPFSARGTAMCLDRGRTDEQFGGWAACRRQSLEDARPHTFGCPLASGQPRLSVWSDARV